MKIQRTIPPAAAPIDLRSLLHGFLGFFLGKRYIRNLEEELRDYFGVKHVFLAGSGKAALTIILRALKTLSPDKTKVLIPAYTCFSVPSAVVRAGLQVLLCDVDQKTLDFDHNNLENCSQNDILCIVATHLFGLPADMEKIKDFGQKNGIFVVEDAAQAMGGKYQERFLGSMGDVGFFSLGRGKSITCGSGGIIITNSDAISQEIEREIKEVNNISFREMLKEFLKVLIMSVFIRPSFYWLPSGLSFLRLGETVYDVDFPLRKFSGTQAGLLAGWQRRLDESNEIRTRNAFGLITELNLPQQQYIKAPYLRLPILVDSKMKRKNIDSISRKKGLGISRMYPNAVNMIEDLKDQFKGLKFPMASLVAESLRTLPTHQFVSGKDILTIARCFDNEQELFSVHQPERTYRSS